MDWSAVQSLVIPDGDVIKVACSTGVLWEKVTIENRWNLLERTEFRGERADATYYYNPANSNHKMHLSENVYVNGLRRINNGVYYSALLTSGAGYFSTLSNITENSFTLKSGTAASELGVSFPFHLNAGETISVTHTRSGHNRSGYQIFNTDGTLKSYVAENLSNSPGAANTTEYTSTEECWFFWICGRYDANTSVTISEIVVTVV